MFEFAEVGTGNKAYRHGTHRAVAPEQTIARVRPLMGAFGITRIANLTGLDRTGIPVVMVTAKDQKADRVWAQMQGAKGYVTKPYSREDIVAQLESF